ncbi:unnamed protein product [Anisakis simplex]|uniref:Peritrophin-44 n=2 Tax=Anisakis simplex TaxID=6269 RepID=A0A0M3J3R7_ANISI|nr:unnamed protein product [Anisakis simplex]
MLPDGAHELLKCHHRFVLCSNGVTSLTSCTKGLVFNGLTGQCDYPENVASCSAREPITTTSTTVTPGISSVGEEESKCSNKADGMYVDQCSEEYYVCSNGMISKFVCPVGLVYNTERSYCDYKQNVRICGANGIQQQQQASTTTAPPFMFLRTTWTTRTPILQDNKLGEQGCSVLPNGPQALGDCLPQYMVCSEGTTRLASCSKGLIFNRKTSLCDYPQRIPPCAGLSDAASGNTLQSDALPTGGQKLVSETLHSDAKCENRADGLYSVGCSPSYFMCSNGKTNEFKCSAGLFFNIQLSACDYQNNIPACNQNVAVGTTDVPFAAESTQKSVFPSQDIQPSSASIVVGGCSSKLDGNYPESDCSHSFYTCSVGISFLLSSFLGSALYFSGIGTNSFDHL